MQLEVAFDHVWEGPPKASCMQPEATPHSCSGLPVMSWRLLRRSRGYMTPREVIAVTCCPSPMDFIVCRIQYLWEVLERAPHIH